MTQPSLKRAYSCPPLSPAGAETLRSAFARATAAHVVIDVQSYYCQPERLYMSVTRAAVNDVAQKIVPFARAVRPYVVQGWVVHAVGSMGWRRLTKARLRGELPKGAVRDGDMVVGKRAWDGFYNTTLDRELKKRGVDTLLLSGMFMNECVMETACTARKKGYNVFVIDDLSVPSRVSRYECHQDMAGQGIEPVSVRHVRALMREARP